jgi:ABC-type nitrate/sulfonate/bicarbonate transport system substrate-binding protein
MRLAIDRRKFLKLSAAASAAATLGGRAASAGTPMTMQAAWINDAEFAGYFAAIDKGYYSAEGMDLTYLPGGPDVIPESTIIAGKADLAAQYQKNPIGIVSLASKPIKTPQDLVGKTLAVPPVNVISVEAMLKLNNIDKAQVNIVPYAYDPTPLIKGEIDASLDFTTNVPFTIKQAGPEAVSFLLYDFGFTIFNDTVVVTEDTLNAKRKELVSWLRASRKGWDENFVDPAAFPPMWADTWFKGTGRTVENEIYFNTAQKPLMVNEGGIFAMSEESIEKNIKALSEVGIKATRDMFDTTLLAEI